MEGRGDCWKGGQGRLGRGLEGMGEVVWFEGVIGSVDHEGLLWMECRVPRYAGGCINQWEG